MNSFFISYTGGPDIQRRLVGVCQQHDGDWLKETSQQAHGKGSAEITYCPEFGELCDNSGQRLFAYGRSNQSEPNIRQLVQSSQQLKQLASEAGITPGFQVKVGPNLQRSKASFIDSQMVERSQEAVAVTA